MTKTSKIVSITVASIVVGALAAWLPRVGPLAIHAARADVASCPAQRILFAGSCRDASWISANLVTPDLQFLGAAAGGGAPGERIVIYERVNDSTARGVELSTALPLPAGTHPHPTRGGYNIERFLRLQVFDDQAGHRIFQSTSLEPVFLETQDEWSTVKTGWSAVDMRPDHTGTYLHGDGTSEPTGFLGQSVLAVTGSVSAILLDGPTSFQVQGASQNPLQLVASVAVVQWYPTPHDCPPQFMWDCNVVSVLVQDGADYDENGDVTVNAHNETEILCGCWNGNDYLIGSGGF
jgi:hypothetical protein